MRVRCRSAKAVFAEIPPRRLIAVWPAIAACPVIESKPGADALLTQTQLARSFLLTVMGFRSGQRKPLAVEQIFLSIVLTAPMSSRLMILRMRLLTLLILPRVGAHFGLSLTNSHNRPAA